MKMTRSVEILREKTKDALLGGDEKAKQKHQERGKLLARDRINLLLDKSSAFLELSTLAANEMYDDGVKSAGVVTGIGRING